MYKTVKIYIVQLELVSFYVHFPRPLICISLITMCGLLMRMEGELCHGVLSLKTHEELRSKKKK